jgi:CDP-diacylglycerol pyrophosphatase
MSYMGSFTKNWRWNGIESPILHEFLTRAFLWEMAHPF